MGPCAFWIAPRNSTGVGKVWSKIYEYDNDGKDSATWCSESINAKGLFDIVIPSNIPSGEYILRSEIVDLTNAYVSNYDDFTMGPRVYSGCVVIDVTGGDDTPLKNPVSILDVYKPYNKTPMFLKNAKAAGFKLPGPAPYTTGKPPAAA
ncbi:hypothetical protein H4S07_000732 [Coemansia furcata]|uniref:Uncharacterized protein n=1 Tax=Coemansia furcata TaxID=417177 RepID=A0ACC1LQP3_9FUNG|nr:hypothetical protein H4S07_000732 [Coemansia furcata]